MKIRGDLVGAAAGPLEREVDARWLMAYAAALGETAPCYLDTLRPQGIVAHPLFPVCYEWPALLQLRAALPSEVALRAVHATHDLRLHRPLRVGERLLTTAKVQAVEARRAGAYVRSRIATVDVDGMPVTTTEYGSLYLAVTCDRGPGDATPGGGRSTVGREGDGGACDADPEAAHGEAGSPADPAHSLDVEAAVAVSPLLAHVYSECARIWNPIHTDRAAAGAAGLPAIILHGTATLALAVSAVLASERSDAAPRVRRIACRFAGMVRMPSSLTVRGRWRPAEPGHRECEFTVLSAEGKPAVRDGRLLLVD